VRGGDMRVGDVHVSDMPRPVWLLNEPVLLSADLQQLRQEGVILEQGPERIESGWWDGKGVARDYYIARQIQGARWWVFQERQTKGWYLHGVFA
jgi:protein ImuB